MKYLSLLVIFACLSLQSGFSQIKEQYVDGSRTSTTVVVKEDNADDFDILNSQFSSAGMGDVIMIKTEKLTPKSPDAEVTPAEAPTPKKVVKETTQPARKTASLPKTRKKATEVYYKGVGKSSHKKLKRTRKRRFKNRKFKKRKRRKRRKVSCYRF